MISVKNCTDASCFETTENKDGTLTISDYNCTDTDVIIPKTINGKTVTVIGNAAFTCNDMPEEKAYIYNRNSDGSIDYTSLNSYAGENQGNIVIPVEVNGVKLTNIGMQAFYYCLIQGVTIPESVTHIGNGAFYNGDKTINHLTEVIIKGKSGPSDFTEYGSSIWGWASGYSDSNITWNG